MEEVVQAQETPVALQVVEAVEDKMVVAHLVPAEMDR